jgi:hypothetical protein
MERPHWKKSHMLAGASRDAEDVSRVRQESRARLEKDLPIPQITG